MNFATLFNISKPHIMNFAQTNFSRDDPKGPASTGNILDTESFDGQEEEQVNNINIFVMQYSVLTQVIVPDVPFVCHCEPKPKPKILSKKGLS